MYTSVHFEGLYVFNKGRGMVVDGNNLRVIGVRGGRTIRGWGFVIGSPRGERESSLGFV